MKRGGEGNDAGGDQTKTKTRATSVVKGSRASALPLKNRVAAPVEEVALPVSVPVVVVAPAEALESEEERKRRR